MHCILVIIYPATLAFLETNLAHCHDLHVCGVYKHGGVEVVGGEPHCQLSKDTVSSDMFLSGSCPSG